MKNNTNYTINFVEETIEITKKFAKAAQVINSTEYRDLLKLKNDFKDYRVVIREIKKNDSKKVYKGLTIEEMKRFIAMNNSGDMVAFEQAITLAKKRQGSYAVIKKWFLNRYKDAYEREIESILDDAIEHDDAA